MRNFKDEFNWVNDIFKNNEITIALNHDSYNRKVFNGDDVELKIERFLEMFRMDLYLNEIKPSEKFIAFDSTCDECGSYIHYVYDTNKKELLDYTLDENRQYVRNRCERIGDYSFEINFPTGVLLCMDKLPFSTNMLNDLNSKYSLNSKLGIKETTLNYASKDIFHVFVGNSCPSVFKKDNLIAVGHSGDNENQSCLCGAEDCDCEYQEYYPIEDSEKISTICTDLWWTSIVDIEVYSKLLIDYFGEEKAQAFIKELKPIETRITPGVYKCTDFRKNDYEDYHNRPSVLATLELKAN